MLNSLDIDNNIDLYTRKKQIAAEKCRDAIKAELEKMLFSNGLDDSQVAVMIKLGVHHSTLTTTKLKKKELPIQDIEDIRKRNLAEIPDIEFDNEAFEHMFRYFALNIVDVLNVKVIGFEHCSGRLINFFTKMIDIIVDTAFCIRSNSLEDKLAQEASNYEDDFYKRFNSRDNLMKELTDLREALGWKMSNTMHFIISHVQL